VGETGRREREEERGI
jgi:hypothetical protein